MHRKSTATLTNENGTALLIAMIILMVVTFIGVAANNTSTIENMISGNDRLQKVAFHAADGGTETGHELLEENFSCDTGFTVYDIGGTHIEPGNANYVPTPYDHRFFWFNMEEPTSAYPTDTVRDIRIGVNDTDPHTNLAYFGNTALSDGNALQMIAGYDGKGFSAAAGGAHIISEIHSQRIGLNNSQSIVMIHWRHVIGQEGTCKY